MRAGRRLEPFAIGCWLFELELIYIAFYLPHTHNEISSERQPVAARTKRIHDTLLPSFCPWHRSSLCSSIATESQSGRCYCSCLTSICSHEVGHCCIINLDYLLREPFWLFKRSHEHDVICFLKELRSLHQLNDWHYTTTDHFHP